MNKILIIIGVVLAVLGIIANSYQVVVDQGLFQGEESVKPYGHFMFPLIAIGLVLVLVGVFIPDGSLGRRRN